MEVLKVILMAVALVAIGMLGMAITMLVKKGGKFPNTHVSGNKHLKEQGVSCVQTQDRLAQREAWKQVSYKNASFTPDMKAGK